MMSYLKQLKQKAKALRNLELEAQIENKRKYAFYEQQIKPVMHKLVRYICELSENLNFVKPEIKTDYRIMEGKELKELNHKKYMTRVDSEENTKYVALNIEIEGPTKLEFYIDVYKEAEKLVEYLYNRRVDFIQHKIAQGNDGIIRTEFEIKPKITAKFEFKADIANSKIVLVITNFDQIGIQSHILLPERINDSFLEELTEYVVRERKGFLVTELDSNVKIKIQKMLLAEEKTMADELREMENISNPKKIKKA